MHRLLKQLGHPERNLPPVIHVAGTNGKGSVIAIMQAILEASGYRVQTYTSPHLVDFTERVRLANGPISHAALTNTLKKCEAINGNLPITYFEITTAAALVAFSKSTADILLLEVGLGGRLDATNVVEKPLLTVVTPIGLDHEKFLGQTLSSIAAEKAAILKTGVPAIIGRQPSAATRAIVTHANRIGVPLLLRHSQRGPWPGRWTARAKGHRMIARINDWTAELPFPSLKGDHQIDNAGLAIASLKQLDGFEISLSSLAAGLTSIKWPARLQCIDHGELRAMLPDDAELWLDGGHNPAAAIAIAQWCKTEQKTSPHRPLVLIVGMLETKALVAFLTPLASVATFLCAVPIMGENAALSTSKIECGARAVGIIARQTKSVPAALNYIAKNFKSPRVLICGSLYLAGTVLAANTTTGFPVK